MSYSDFGLDTNKKSKDASYISGSSYDPFSETQFTVKGFSLCFQNWAVPESTLARLLTTQPTDNTERMRCWHCRQVIPAMYFDQTEAVCLCRECVSFGLEYLKRPSSPVPAGTQFKLF